MFSLAGETAGSMGRGCRGQEGSEQHPGCGTCPNLGQGTPRAKGVQGLTGRYAHRRRGHGLSQRLVGKQMQCEGSTFGRAPSLTHLPPSR